MSLHRWQSTLLQALHNTKEAPKLTEQWAYELSATEQTQLKALQNNQGAAVTQEVANWWRYARLRTALPFSMRLIQYLKQEHLIEPYQSKPFKTLFFLREAELFLEYLNSQALAPTILKNMALFECTLHHLKRHQHKKPYSQSLTLQYCPQTVITALLQNSPLPDEISGGIKVYFNSEWDELWRFTHDLKI